jgi:MHS family alpha-ketoglutarate permease-like MFS transporter
MKVQQLASTSGKQSNQLRSVISACIGNLVEWYDWYAYAAFAIYFAPAFFPASDPTTQLLNSAGIFALGFLMRIVGGWVFGNLADRKGRKFAMTVSILLMSAGSMVIAFTPTYASIGIWAPVLLTFARLMQGLSVGGEYGTSATYLSEIATPNKRGFYSSFQYVTLIGGQILAISVLLLLQQFIANEKVMLAWGWRVPFIIGALLSLVALYLRSTMEEPKPPEKQPTAADSKPKSRMVELLKHRKEVAVVAALTMGGTVAFYTFTTYAQKFLINTVHLTKNKATIVMFIALLIYAGLQPVYGMISDRFGRRPMLIAFGVLGVVFTVPLLTALSSANSATKAFVFIMLSLLIVSNYTAINAIVKAELFPANIRALGVGFPYAITVAIFGGTAEAVALGLKKIGHETWYYWYVTFCIAVSLIVFLTIKETKGSLDDD